MQAIFETAFDAVYLITVVTLGIIMIKRSLSVAYSSEAESGVFSRGKIQYLPFAIMAVTLGAGDAFHLVPRAIALCTTGLKNYTEALGIGKLITSVTMTAFYCITSGAVATKSAGTPLLPRQYGFARRFALCCVCCRRIIGQARTRLLPGEFIGISPSPCWAE